ncbi:glutamate-1-semialdehyde-2,1-aminomutase [Desulfuribacillus stibiiarsenatis]|uniref:Glutamate-1-semialdehyde 2,1-aminomutase n=1 Tax=Desulfuribacillus stibiiarsenatis TaxID=1390249 RepID=A0A1E5L219_9FIRM|nr:glutamate-1-semialdehyde 2,1-aminomutase [Desulfuribacillus stibiiarsenatis]OEH84202.1 glutamate-1-semialdehyde-2,1-aminomutase [Desulfuribacillus stibiiarsenatis]
MNRPNSAKAFEEAKKVIPGGVNSPVRAFRAIGTHPVFVKEGHGSKFTDIDGKQYIDYVGSWGPLIHGHAHPEVIDAIRDYAGRGTSYGAPTELETEMAKMVIDILPSVEMVRFVSSGTEATMSALRLARGYTKRNKILKFEGCFHGHADSLLIKAGSGVATLGLPDSPGVPESIAAHTLTVPYNDQESLQLAFEKFGEDIAAVILEPVAGNMGLVTPKPGYLEFIRKITKEYGALLIFDEVMSGFRVHYRGAQALYNIDPDLTCLGKVIGGGLPVGAYAGKREIMENIAPAGSIYQAGTLSGNPLAMIAGYTTLKLLGQPGVFEELERQTIKLANGIKKNAEDLGIPHYSNQVGSMFCLYFNEHEVTDYQMATKSDTARFAEYYRYLLEEGVYIAPSQYESCFMSTVHTDEDIAKTIEATYNAMKKTIK